VTDVQESRAKKSIQPEAAAPAPAVESNPSEATDLEPPKAGTLSKDVPLHDVRNARLQSSAAPERSLSAAPAAPQEDKLESAREFEPAAPPPATLTPREFEAMSPQLLAGGGRADEQKIPSGAAQVDVGKMRDFEQVSLQDEATLERSLASIEDALAAGGSRPQDSPKSFSRQESASPVSAERVLLLRQRVHVLAGLVIWNRERWCESARRSLEEWRREAAAGSAAIADSTAVADSAAIGVACGS
jgi:hypothetical protein